MKNRGLGRGLDALLNNDEISQSISSDNSNLLAVEKLVSGQFQPRKIFNQDSLKELAESIKAQGIIQPILVRMETCLRAVPAKENF